MRATMVLAAFAASRICCTGLLDPGPEPIHNTLNCDKVNKMACRTTKRPVQRLFELADTQQGFFTAKEAARCGYSDAMHTYHVYRGNWVREERGIYRLVRYPQTDEAQLVIWSLWSRNRKGERQGVYSHQTALTIHDLTDANPAKLHMTVPRDFHRFKPPPEVLVLHRRELELDEIEARRGYAVTRPLRTICDLAAGGRVTDGALAAAVRQALERGMVTRKALRSAQSGNRRLREIMSLLRG